MATAFGAIFTSTISETVTLNGAVRGNTNIVSIDNVNNVAEKIVSIPAGEGHPTIIGNFANAANAAKYANYEYKYAKYCRVTNLSTDQNIEVAWVSNGMDDQCREPGKEAAADSCRFLLKPGQTSIMWDTNKGKLGEATEPIPPASLTDLSYIWVYNPNLEATEVVDVELFVASSNEDGA